MLRQGPVSAFLHGVVEYVAGALLIAAPFLFGFDSEAATAVSVVVGVVVLVVTASSDLPTGLTKTLPVTIHAVLDVVTAGFLIAAPFLFGFQDETAPAAFMIVLGVIHLLLTIATRFLPPREQVQPGRQAS
jgi:VIT1/CCC1 family predicted Fe2+/Mn2+ transporter